MNDLKARSRDVAFGTDSAGDGEERLRQRVDCRCTDEVEERRRNLQELVNAALQYQEENDEGDLEGFLATAALSSDADNKDTAADRVTLMTLHSSKGLEFPVVCLVGLEQGFPSYRSWMIRPH